MYADRVEAEMGMSVKDRLSGTTFDTYGRRRPIGGKRQRHDDEKWVHDLYDGDRKRGNQDLRLKLQKKSVQETLQSKKDVRDLREKLSGLMHPHPITTMPPRQKSHVEVSRPTRKSASADVSISESKKVSNSAPKKNSQKKESSLDSFLQSLGLEKYSLVFQVEEVDMTALVHMSDDDLKTIGVPMGPRKKILLALESSKS